LNKERAEHDCESHMMTNKPPYTITDKAADYLAKIVETASCKNTELLKDKDEGNRISYLRFFIAV